MIFGTSCNVSGVTRFVRPAAKAGEVEVVTFADLADLIAASAAKLCFGHRRVGTAHQPQTILVGGAHPTHQR